MTRSNNSVQELLKIATKYWCNNSKEDDPVSYSECKKFLDGFVGGIDGYVICEECNTFVREIDTANYSNKDTRNDDWVCENCFEHHISKWEQDCNAEHEHITQHMSWGKI